MSLRDDDLRADAQRDQIYPPVGQQPEVRTVAVVHFCSKNSTYEGAEVRVQQPHSNTNWSSPIKKSTAGYWCTTLNLAASANGVQGPLTIEVALADTRHIKFERSPDNARAPQEIVLGISGKKPYVPYYEIGGETVWSTLRAKYWPNLKE
jgi:hypothetical protein